MILYQLSLAWREAAGLYDETGEPRNVKQSLIVDAFATGVAGIFGSSSGTAFIESATGIEEGGRTGLNGGSCGSSFLAVYVFLSAVIGSAFNSDGSGSCFGRRIYAQADNSNQLGQA